MVLKINKDSNPAEIKEGLEKLKSSKKSKTFNLKKWSGKLKRGFDGIKYQNEVRSDWQ
jgi:hypothetical protein